MRKLTVLCLALLLSGCTSIHVVRDPGATEDASASGFRGVRMVTYTQNAFAPTGLFWREESAYRAEYAGQALRESGFFNEVHQVSAPPPAGLHLQIETSVSARHGWSGKLFNGILSLATVGLVPYRVPQGYAHDVTVYREGRVIQRRTYAQQSIVYNGVLLGFLTAWLPGENPELATARQTRDLIERVLGDIQRTGVLREPLP